MNHGLVNTLTNSIKMNLNYTSWGFKGMMIMNSGTSVGLFFISLDIFQIELWNIFMWLPGHNNIKYFKTFDVIIFYRLFILPNI